MRRKEGRYLEPAEVLRRCKQQGRVAFCAGQVLALIGLLKQRGWAVVKLAQLSKVSRQLLDAVLLVQRFPTSDRWWKVARAFGLRLSEFDRLAEQALAALPR